MPTVGYLEAFPKSEERYNQTLRFFGSTGLFVHGSAHFLYFSPLPPPTQFLIESDVFSSHNARSSGFVIDTYQPGISFLVEGLHLPDIQVYSFCDFLKQFREKGAFLEILACCSEEEMSV